MTPSDDDTVPADDAIAAGARRALDNLADTSTPAWGSVLGRAQHIRQVRIALVTSIALVLACGVVAVSAFANDGRSTVAVSGGPGGASTSTTSTSTTTSTTTTTLPSPTSTTGGSRGPSGAPASGETPPASTPSAVPYATVDDLDGSISLGVAPSDEIANGDELTLAASVTNISGHPVVVGGLGVYLVCPTVGGVPFAFRVTDDLVVAPGE